MGTVGRAIWRLLAVVVLLIVVFPVAGASATRRSDGSTPAPANIVQLVEHVPAGTLNQVGAGRLSPVQFGAPPGPNSPPSGPDSFGITPLTGQLTSHGKPELLTMNLAWCPHCAANSWALAIALSRFGQLGGLGVLNTGKYYCTLVINPCYLVPTPCFASTDGLSFLHATFKSKYLSFGAIVLQDVEGHGVENPNRQQGKALMAFDPLGETPAVDVGGAYGFVNSGFSPGTLAHKTWSRIANSLADPHAAIAKRIDGLANLFAAAICKATKGQPASVCKSKGVMAAGKAHLG